VQVIKDIPIDKINIPQERLTSTLTQEDFESLSASLRELGLISPISVTPDGSYFILVSGLNRLRAAQSIGWTTIPAIITSADPTKASILNITENLARGKTNPIDEAYAIQNLITMTNMDMTQLAHQLNRTTQWIDSRLDLLLLPDGLQEAIQNGQLSIAAAKELSAVEDPHILEYLTNQAIQSGASAKTINAWLRKMDTNALNSALMDHSQTPPLPTPDQLNPTIDCFACGTPNSPYELRPELLCETCRHALHTTSLPPAPGTGPG